MDVTFAATRITYHFRSVVEKLISPPAKAWWCPEVCLKFRCSCEIEVPRLKPGGVQTKDHRRNTRNVTKRTEKPKEQL